MLDFNLLHALGSVPAIIYIASLSFAILLFLCIRYYVINKNQRIDFLKYKIELDPQNSNLKTENNKLIEKLEPVTDAEAKAAEILSGVTQTLDDKNKELIYLEEKLRTLDPDGEYQLTYMNRDSQNFKKGLTVTTFYLAKGLEFDQVFGVFHAEDNSGLAAQARYITATRALHELHMYDVED